MLGIGSERVEEKAEREAADKDVKREPKTLMGLWLDREEVE